MSASVLVVCLGNICRSPTAEVVLRAKLARAGASAIAVASAGTHAAHAGEPAHASSMKHARQRGYDLDGFRSRPLVTADFIEHDWILAMDEMNLAELRRRAPPGPRAQLALFMSVMPLPWPRAVPDPWGKTPADFDRALDLIEPACDAWVLRLCEPTSP